MELVALVVVIFLCILILGLYVDIPKSIFTKKPEPQYRDTSIYYRTVKKKGK